MAKIKNGHFGSFQGKIGAVTGRKRKGIFYISQSITHNPSNTKAQQQQRAVFAACAKVISRFSRAVEVGFSQCVRPGQTALNAAEGFHMARVDRTTYTLSPDQIVVARGSFVGVSTPAISSPSEGIIKLIWDSTIATGSMASDKDTVYLCLYEPSTNRTTLQSALRSQASISCGYPPAWEGLNAHAYVFAVSPDGKVSDSDYLGQVSCN